MDRAAEDFADRLARCCAGSTAPPISALPPAQLRDALAGNGAIGP